MNKVGDSGQADFKKTVAEMQKEAAETAASFVQTGDVQSAQVVNTEQQVEEFQSSMAKVVELHAAILSDNAQGVLDLINKRANLYQQNKSGQTALHVAAMTNPKILESLIKDRALPLSDLPVPPLYEKNSVKIGHLNSKDNQGKTALDYVVEFSIQNAKDNPALAAKGREMAALLKNREATCAIKENNKALESLLQNQPQQKLSKGQKMMQALKKNVGKVATHTKNMMSRNKKQEQSKGPSI